MSLEHGIRIVVYAIVAGLIFALLWWLVDFIGFPPPFGHYIHVVIVVVAVLVIISFLLHLVGVKVWKNDDSSPLP